MTKIAEPVFLILDSDNNIVNAMTTKTDAEKFVVYLREEEHSKDKYKVKELHPVDYVHSFAMMEAH